MYIHVIEFVDLEVGRSEVVPVWVFAFCKVVCKSSQPTTTGVFWGKFFELSKIKWPS